MIDTDTPPPPNFRLMLFLAIIYIALHIQLYINWSNANG